MTFDICAAAPHHDIWFPRAKKKLNSPTIIFILTNAFETRSSIHHTHIQHPLMSIMLPILFPCPSHFVTCINIQRRATLTRPRASSTILL